MFPSEELLERAGNGEKSALVELDSNGFLLRGKETPEEYVRRIRMMKKHCDFFREKTAGGSEYEVYSSITISDRNAIPEEIMEEASKKTLDLYGFSISWVPGYFIDKGLGWLWGGCALSEDEPDSIPVFIIKSKFRKSPRWFIYRRDELLAHELCHAARSPLLDPPLEEHFAYATAASSLRRYMGNCFQRDRDAVLFLLPVFLLLGIQVAIHIFGAPLYAWPFWICAFLWPAFLLIRNALQRATYFRAEQKIRAAGFVNPGAVLFRCTTAEIRTFSGMDQKALNAEISERREKDVRFQILAERFMDRPS